MQGAHGWYVFVKLSTTLPTPVVGDEPHQPTSFSFPKKEFEKKQVVERSFQASWFKQHTWPHYNEEQDIGPQQSPGSVIVGEVVVGVLGGQVLVEQYSYPWCLWFKGYTYKVWQCWRRYTIGVVASTRHGWWLHGLQELKFNVYLHAHFGIVCTFVHTYSHYLL